MDTFRIYIFTSTEFEKGERRLGTTQIKDTEKFKQHWQTKIKGITIEYFSHDISIIKRSQADKILKRHTDGAYRIVANLQYVISIVNKVERVCLTEFESKQRKEIAYQQNRLRLAEKMKSQSKLDYVSDEEEKPNSSDEEFIASEDDVMDVSDGDEECEDIDRNNTENNDII